MSDLQSWMIKNAETDASLSEKIGISRVQVSRLRRGIHRPSIATARKLEKVTTIPAAEFVMGGVGQ